MSDLLERLGTIVDDTAYDAIAEIERLREEAKDTDRILRASVPEEFRKATSPVGCAQNYIVSLEQRIEELEKLDPDALTKATNALFQVLREDGYHIFTAAKIDAAWELVEWHRTRGAVMSARDMERALEKFGIERDGDGWKIGGSDD